MQHLKGTIECNIWLPGSERPKADRVKPSICLVECTVWWNKNHRATPSFCQEYTVNIYLSCNGSRTIPSPVVRFDHCLASMKVSKNLASCVAIRYLT